MANSQYTLSWDSHQKNICKGLSSLQERGEFVDMTLAADGHFVKVHKMVLSLISPYIKDLISSADCPHPVIFLNNISHSTLCSVLEYIYTGEVIVCKDKLGELMQAGKALHIKGLVEMVENSTQSGEDLATLEHMRNAVQQMHDYESTSNTKEKVLEETHSATELLYSDTDDVYDGNESSSEVKPPKIRRLSRGISASKKTETSAGDICDVQYTMSNQGSLQMVLNRYIYFMRYMYKNSTRRMWRCISYPRDLRCPAYVMTENDRIIERCCTHNHPFHDRNIMRKVREGTIFSVLKDVELQLEIKKRTKVSTDTHDEEDMQTE